MNILSAEMVVVVVVAATLTGHDKSNALDAAAAASIDTSIESERGVDRWSAWPSCNLHELKTLASSSFTS